MPRPAERVLEKGDPPRQLPPPFAKAVTHDMLVVGWSADGAPFDKAEHTGEGTVWEDRPLTLTLTLTLNPNR